MNTTTDTAAPFTPNAVYSVPSLSIRYAIQFNGDRSAARIQDDEHVTEWLPVTPTHVDDDNGGWLTDSVIDANGYAVPVSSCEELPPPQGIRNTMFYFRHKNADAPGFSGISESVHNVPGWRAAVQRLKILCPDNWRDYVPMGVVSRFPVAVEDSVYKLHEGTFWPVDMPDEVIAILAPHVGKRETRFIFDFGDIGTGRSWNEVYDISGYIGRSTGSVKIPLLIHSRRSHGGHALTGSIVRVLTAKGKRILYQHPNYHSDKLPQFAVLVYHDKGCATIKVTATDETAAKQLVMAAEGCPASAIAEVRRLS